MGPYEIDYKSLFLSVLSDWRVIAITIGVFATWALLRYVGLVFRSSRRLSVPPPKAMKRAKASKAEKAESIEIEE